MRWLLDSGLKPGHCKNFAKLLLQLYWQETAPLLLCFGAGPEPGLYAFKARLDAGAAAEDEVRGGPNLDPAGQRGGPVLQLQQEQAHRQEDGVFCLDIMQILL